MSLTPKKILITGGASGIGRAVSAHFLENGWVVGTIDRNQYPVTDTAREYHFTGDLRDRNVISHAIEKFSIIKGSWEIVFCNAAVAHSGYFFDVPWDCHEEMVDTNLTSYLYLLHQSICKLRHSRSPLIIVSTSIASMYGVPLLATYSATKLALVGLVEALSIELEPFAIRCIYINIGRVDTPMQNKIKFWQKDRQNRTSWKPLLLPELKKNTAYYALQSPVDIGPLLLSAYSQRNGGNLFFPPVLRKYFAISRLIPAFIRRFRKKYMEKML
jgi:NAD(P)-dependent dehydrogenase (short-subunit alcohol dehydrogenase family)